MTEKKHTYHADTLALPPLKMVLGEIPEPDPDEIKRSFRVLGESKSEAEARDLISKLIGHLKSND